MLVPVAAYPAALIVARLKERLSRCYSKSGVVGVRVLGLGGRGRDLAKI